MTPVDARPARVHDEQPAKPSWQEKFRVGYSYIESIKDLGDDEFTDFLRAWISKATIDNPQLRGVFQNPPSYEAGFPGKDTQVTQKFLNSAGVLLSEAQTLHTANGILEESQVQGVGELLRVVGVSDNLKCQISPELKSSVEYFTGLSTSGEGKDNKPAAQWAYKIKYAVQREGDAVDEWKALWLDEERPYLWRIGFTGMVRVNRNEAVAQLPELIKRASVYKDAEESMGLDKLFSEYWSPSLTVSNLVGSYRKHAELRFLADVSYLENPVFANGEPFSVHLYGDLLERVRGWFVGEEGYRQIQVPPDRKWQIFTDPVL